MKFKLPLFICVLVFLSSCGSKKNVVQKHAGTVLLEATPVKLPSVKQVEHIQKLDSKKLNQHTLKYIRTYAPIAVYEMHQHNIPASITLAQGILESGNGRSTLAKKSNNHFGIKCHRGWTGERVYHDDDEKGECFRKYQYVETSYKDHSEFLTKRKRYAFLFNYGPKAYKKWAKGLKKAGYATDKKYPYKLIKIIKEYQLYDFDNVSKKDFKQFEKSSSKKTKRTRLKTTLYIIKKGDTWYSLSKRFETTVAYLKKINNIDTNELSIGQKIKVPK